VEVQLISLASKRSPSDSKKLKSLIDNVSLSECIFHCYILGRVQILPQLVLDNVYQSEAVHHTTLSIVILVRRLVG
jgi:hypothetical protein